ncbi:MAG: hypothetical protein K6A05_04900 [Lachnospiraceae bacterium]|nr:hypothetical protein [Lachnospiraceae bacterium]
MGFIIGFVLGGTVVGFLYHKHEKKQRIYSYNAGRDRGFVDGMILMEHIDEFNEDGE